MSKQEELDRLYALLPDTNARELVAKIVDLEIELEKDCNQ